MPGFNIEARSHIGPFMRSIFSIAVLFFSALAPNARAQAEATFPLSEDTAEEGSKDASSEEQRSSDDPAIPSETPAPAPQPQGPPPQVDDPNPYGVPPAPPPPLPGNPYGTVPHRPPTPPPNPYVGEPRRAATAASPQVVEETNWSVGGGLVGETSSSALSAGYGPITQSRLRPSLLFERRLSRALHLLLQSSVVYQKSRLEGPNAVDTSIEESSYEEFNLRFEGGLRWVANPGGPVELGMSHVISLANYQSISEGRPNIYYLYLPNLGDAEIDEWTIGLSNSFLAERRLIPHLWLRMAVGLVGIHYRTQKIITYTESEDEETGERVESEDESTANGFNIGLTPSLALQLRLTF